MDKQTILFQGIMRIACSVVALLEDYLGIPPDKSKLAKRRDKAR